MKAKSPPSLPRKMPRSMVTAGVVFLLCLVRYWSILSGYTTYLTIRRDELKGQANASLRVAGKLISNAEDKSTLGSQLVALTESNSTEDRVEVKSNFTATDSSPKKNIKRKHKKHDATSDKKQKSQDPALRASVDGRNSDDGVLSSLHLCRIAPDPVFKSKPIRINEPLGVSYQCAGPEYYKFSQRLLELATNPEKYDKDASTWGKRNAPIPPNKSVLFFGNSHTRQTFQSFMCQYKSIIINSTQSLVIDSKGSGVWDIRLDNNVTVFGVFNTPHVYSPRWAALVEGSLNRPLDSIDVMVLGKFNSFSDSKNTSFVSLMKNLTVGTGIDFERASTPKIDQVAKVYSGPILAVSMFAEHDVSRHKGVLKKIEGIKKKGRTNIVPINGRQYTEYIGECASDMNNYVSTCTTDKTAFGYTNGHRCVGHSGGHPDLIAWDIIEEFYRILG